MPRADGVHDTWAIEEPMAAVDDQPTGGAFSGIVGRSAALPRLLRLVESVANAGLRLILI
jgi:hypothetical protein